MKKAKLIFLTSVCLAMLVSLAPIAWAQAGGIFGEVVILLPDGSKNLATNVLVEFFRLDVKEYHRIKTDSQGRFAHIGLPSGRYAVVLSGEELNPFYEYGLRISPGAAVERSYAMRPGSGQRLTLEQVEQHLTQGGVGGEPGAFVLGYFDTVPNLWLRSNGNVGIARYPDFNYRLDVAGDIRARGTVYPSDARLKTNVSLLTNVLEKLEQIRGVSYEQTEEVFPVRREIGVIAQEVETVFPELVTTAGDEHYKGVDYSRLTAVLIEAVKELKARNEALRQRIEALEQAIGNNY